MGYFGLLLLALVLTILHLPSYHCDQDIIDLRLAGIPVYIQAIPSKELLHDFLKAYGTSDKKFSSFMSILPSIRENLAVSKYCQADLHSLTEGDSSAAKVFPQYIDASSKIPNGIIEGHFNWMGEYQECLGIDSVFNNETGKSFKGKYFSTVLYLNGKPALGTYPIIIGMCFPDSCDENDAGATANMLLQYLQFAIAQYYPDIKKQNLTIVEALASEDVKLESGALAVLSVFGIIVVIVLVATLIDYGSSSCKQEQKLSRVEDYDEPYNESSDRTGLLSGDLFSQSIQEGRCNSVKKRLLKLCKAFSVVSNGKKLFGTETAVGPLACLNGLRVMSMWWVILGHTYAFSISVSDNLLYGVELIKRFTFQPIVNGTFSVDSFFFLSGLLVSYLALKEIRENGGLNWAYYVFHRYWRLTPLYAFVILYYTFLFVPTILGPMQFMVKIPEYQKIIDVCKSHWWTNLLYINNMYPNYGNLGKTCLGWSWYLANDMQFYLLLGPIIILMLSKSRKVKVVGISLTIFLIAAGVSQRGFLVWYYGIYDELNATPTKHTDDPWGKNGALYGRPYARFSVYLVGMLTGYVLASSNNRLRIPRFAAVVGWCAAIATGMAVIYGQFYYNHNTVSMNLIQSGFYMAFNRTAWGLCLSWIVLACISGNGGPVQDILSWKFWAPLGRLTYAAYLVHPIVIFTYYYNMRQTLHIYDLNMISLFLSNLVASYLVAFIVSMLVEAPMIQLEKLILGKNLFTRLRYVIGHGRQHFINFFVYVSSLFCRNHSR